MTLEFFHNPIRLELIEGSDIAYGEHSLMENGVTLLPDIENFNFGFVDVEDKLGFVAGDLEKHLTAQDPMHNECIKEFFQLKHGQLYPKQKLKLFMVTTNPEIARKDCLFYLVTAA